ncbi:tetratricopeptide repeat protein [Plantactinospora soyae]|uniref:Tetratricopeptide (TPR) repeat protein n=1 Tax=Plantactinospora soyae TaxID=1544732 RepID=A0A927M5Z0_9ACTN|nr:tetratricopeptide repeat protein [Plantactinospora soyae]MBE1487236.1 tetratricopeptide (TPR) repeat protein [Plantactinospora soyae]
MARTAELADIDALFRTGEPALVVLLGPGGVGKTALAVRWADNVRDRFPDGQLYVDLGGFGGDDPVDPSEALGELLRALGTAPQRVPVTLAEQVALYRSVTADRTLLVLLDNAYSTAQVRALLPAGRSGVLVTSRVRLVGLVADGARLVNLAPLCPAESVLLLSRATGAGRIDREPAEAAQIADICAGLPIALCVAAARLAARPRLSVRRMALDLASETHRLGRLSRTDGLSVQATFDISYRSLHPDVARFYRRLALHPGPEFGAAVTAALLPAGAGNTGDPPGETDSDDPGTLADVMLDALLEASLLEEVTEGHFRFHDLVRLHARQKLERDEPEPERQVVLRGILEWYLAAAREADLVVTPYRRRLPYGYLTPPWNLPRFADRQEALTWLERERVNLIGAGRTALRHGHPALAWQLSDVTWPLLLYRKHYRDRLEIDQRGVEAARSWGEPWAEADMLKRLGRVCTKLGDHEAAERHIRAAILRYREAGDVRGGLDAEEGLAALYRDSGREDRAVEIFFRLVDANREQGDARSTGLSLISLGMLLTALGQPERATGLLREAEVVFAGLADVDPYNGARVLIGLAGALLGKGDLAGAERAATEAARRMRELGSEHEYAEALDQLGQVARRRGETVAARAYHLQALEIFIRLGSSRALGLRRQLDEPVGDLGRDGPPDLVGPAVDPGGEPDAGGVGQLAPG